jgi:hypothetical protein
MQEVKTESYAETIFVSAQVTLQSSSLAKLYSVEHVYGLLMLHVLHVLVRPVNSSRRRWSKRSFFVRVTIAI